LCFTNRRVKILIISKNYTFSTFNIFSFISYLCSGSRPCSPIAAIVKVTATCKVGELPRLLGSTYNIPSENGNTNTLFYNSGDEAKVQCPPSTTISSVTVRNGVNCPKESNVRECSLCDVVDGIQVCQIKV
jgi:hypothetical protein